MAATAWCKVNISRRKIRSTFGNRTRTDGREEFILKIPGFSGELRKIMTMEEAMEWVEKTNGRAFCEAAEASKSGLHGYEQFSKFGECKFGTRNVAIRAASRAFCDKRKDTKK